MTPVSADMAKVLEFVAAQRNAALNDLAILQARVAQLEAEAKQNAAQGADGP